MRLLSLHLRNFRQHQDTLIEFDEGLTAIVGVNGSGKTTLVEAIAFALYGARSVRGRLDSVRRIGAKRGEKTEVQLSFEHGGSSFRIQRLMQDGRLFSGGDPEPIASTTRGVTEKVEQILKMNHEEFSSTFFTQQKGLEFLSGKRGAVEREKFITRMLGFHKLEKSQDLLRAERRALFHELKGMDSVVSGADKLPEQLAREKETFSKLKAELEEAGRVLESAKKNRQKLDARKESWEAQLTKYRELSQKYKDSQSRKSERERALKEIELKLGCSGQGSESLDDLKVSRDGRLEKESSLLKEREQLAEKLSVLKAEQAGFDARVKEKKKALEERLKETQKRIKKLQKLGEESVCPECGQKVGESVGNVLEELSSNRERLTTELKEIEKSVFDQKGLSKIEGQLQRLAGELKQSQKERGKIDQKIEELGQKQQLLSEREVVIKLVKELTTEVEELAKELVKVDFSEKDYQKFRVNLKAAEELLELSRLQRVKVEGAVQKQEAMLQRTKEQIEAAETLKDQLKQGAKRVSELEMGDKFFTDFRKYLNENIRPRLAELSSDFLTELTDGRYTTVEIGQDFTPIILEDGEPKEVISGGEEDIVHLCVRLAMSHMLAERSGQSFSLLVLDEVFGALDSQRRFNVLLLLDRLRSRFEQILIITHVEEVKDTVDHVVQLDFDDSCGELSVGSGFGEVDERAFNF